MKQMEFNDLQQNWNDFLSSALAWAPRIITGIISALLIYLIGFWLIKLIKRLATKAFQKRQLIRCISPTLSFKPHYLGT